MCVCLTLIGGLNEMLNRKKNPRKYVPTFSDTIDGQIRTLICEYD